MKTLLLGFTFLVILLSASFSEAFPQRFDQEIKLPPSVQTVLQHDTITAPILAATNYVKTTYAGPTSAAALDLTSFTHQPDVPRNLTITPTGTTGDLESCVIVVTGTDILGHSITENFTFAADASTAQTGSKAFKTVTNINWPANCESGGFGTTWIVGVGSKLGVKRCTKNAGAFGWAVFDGATETPGTYASSASVVSSNTYTPSGTMNGAKDVELYYSQNFACY